MTPLVLVKCTGCGAGVPATVDDSVACLYCGVIQPCPQDCREHLLRLPREVCQAQAVAAGHLTEAFYQKTKLGRFQVTVLAGGMLLAIGSAFIVAGAVLGLQRMSQWMPAITSFLLPFWLLGVPLGFSVWDMVCRSRARARARGLVASWGARHVRGQCPACGGPLQIPYLVTAIACPHCASPLLANAGMVEYWIADVSRRGVVLQQRAAAMVASAMQREAHLAPLGPIVLVVLVNGGLVLVCLVVYLLGTLL